MEDDGIGMTPEQLNHLKEELPDLEKEGHTGIGLGMWTGASGFTMGSSTASGLKVCMEKGHPYI